MPHPNPWIENRRVLGTAVLLGLSSLGVVGMLTHELFADHGQPAAPALMAPAPSVTDETILAKILPYYGEVAPDWCAEDMACWIGSKADGRTATVIMANLADDLESASQNYADDFIGDLDSHPDCFARISEDPVIVECADGYTDTYKADGK